MFKIDNSILTIMYIKLEILSYKKQRKRKRKKTYK